MEQMEHRLSRSSGPTSRPFVLSFAPSASLRFLCGAGRESEFSAPLLGTPVSIKRGGGKVTICLYSVA